MYFAVGDHGLRQDFEKADDRGALSAISLPQNELRVAMFLVE